MNSHELPASVHHFNYWFNKHGHWMYKNKMEAVKQWRENGIDDLSNPPRNATQYFNQET